jgi:hypothetical protein
MSAWHIYSLIDPLNHRVRYVGKTDDVRRRLRKHITLALHSQRRNHRLDWIRSLVDAGQLPTLAIIESGEGDWKAAEKHWIAFYRMAGAELVNATDGGEGMNNPSAETRAKISAKTKAAMASPEVRAKLLAARASPEYRTRSSVAAKARLASPEARAKYSAAVKRQWQKPEYRAKHLAANKAVWAARRARNNEVL